jgi:predicted metal-dependent phosphoesterase TrpH
MKYIMRIDLHTHSTASDGLFPPAELVRRAHAAGVTVLALTDHDSTAGVLEAQAEGARLGVEVIAGCEINTDLPTGDAHVLGYFVHTDDVAFETELAQRRASRRARGQRMVAKLQAIGIPITWEQVARHADGAVGRPHVAAALIDLGIVGSVQEAFDRYLGRGMPGYVPRDPFTPEQAVALIRRGGGVASLAHPKDIPHLPDLLANLVAASLTGLEVYYGPYSTNDVRQLRALADRFGLIPTGGSDYHGPGIHPTPLGHQPQLPETALLALRRAAGQT